MPRNSKEQNLAAVLATVLVTVTIIIGFVAIILKQTEEKKQTELANAQALSDAAIAGEDAQASMLSAPQEPAATFHKPDQMIGVTMEPGKDFLTELSASLKKALQAEQDAKTKPEADQAEEQEEPEPIELDEEKAKTEIDEMLSEAQDMGMNSVLIHTNTLLGTIQVTDSIHSLSSFDAMNYLLETAREKGLYVYAIYDLSLVPSGTKIKRVESLDVATINRLMKPLGEFAQNYRVDGILLAGCENPKTEESYDDYARYGAGIGFEQYMLDCTKALVTAAADTVRNTDRNIQVGLLADAVWATQQQEPEGLEVSAEVTSLKTNYVDTKNLAESNLLDFVAIQNDSAMDDEQIPFQSVLNWWDQLASEKGTTCYIIHAADRAGTWQDGWGGKSQLAQQLTAVLDSPNLEGSIFRSLGNLMKNPNGTTTALVSALSESGSDVLSARAEPETPQEPQSGETAETVPVEKQQEKQETQEKQEQAPEPKEEGKEPAETSKEESKQDEPKQEEPKQEEAPKELSFAKPSKTTLGTKASEYTFQGTADPESDLTVDGKKVEVDQAGSFRFQTALEPGTNIFTFSQNGRKETFTITRSVQVLQDISPVGSLSLDGESNLEISAIAYKDATVKATVNGQTVSLDASNSANDEVKDEGYQKYVGTYTAPAGSEEVQSIGNIVINATLQGNTESLTGAALSVNKVIKPKKSSTDRSSSQSDTKTDNSPITNGTLVKVTSEQAITFPVGKATIYPDQTCYPLPNGTLDYVVGDKVSVKDGSSYRTYYNLASGRRVYTKDVKAVSGGGKLEGNSISGMTVKATNDYTYVILKSDKPVAFLPNYTGSKFTIDFQYTTSTPGDMNLTKNPMFTEAYWSGSKLNLTFRTTGGFLGYKAYHENGNIVFRFNNPTSISGARIVVDPGHGGSDPGAADNLPVPEKKINWDLAQAVAKALEAKGADVLLLQTYQNGMSMDDRLAKARNFNASLYLSIHTNSSEANTNAAGSECYYFFPFAKSLASRMSAANASGLDTSNRGAQYDVFYVTRDPQFIGILSETGFLTNKKEYAKLQDSSYQSSIGKSVTSAVSAFLENAGAEYAGMTGTQSVGAASDASSGPSSSGGSGNPDAVLDDPNTDNGSSSSSSQGSSGSGNGIVKSIALEPMEMTLSVGDQKTLKVIINGDTSMKKTYTSSNTNVATVDENGLITARGVGTANVKAVVGDQGGTCRVTVVQGTGSAAKTETEAGPKIDVEKVKITKRFVLLKVGQSAELKLKYTPSNASNKDVTWDISSGEKSISLTQSGVVTGIKEGTASVVVISDDTYVRDEITVEVVK